jgi:hypothetical protein
MNSFFERELQSCFGLMVFFKNLIFISDKFLYNILFQLQLTSKYDNVNREFKAMKLSTDEILAMHRPQTHVKFHNYFLT